MKNQKSKKFLQLCQKYGVDSSVVPEILSYREACRITKRDIKTNRDAMAQTMVIIEAFCEQAKFKINYSDPYQRRWFPVFDASNKGFVFSNADYEYWFSRTAALVGSPFVLPTSDHARFMGKHFTELYKKWMLKYKVK